MLKNVSKKNKSGGSKILDIDKKLLTLRSNSK